MKGRKTLACTNWLQERLKRGPVETDVLYAEAKAAGWGDTTLRRAKINCPFVRAVKTGFGETGQWFWAIRD